MLNLRALPPIIEERQQPQSPQRLGQGRRRLSYATLAADLEEDERLRKAAEERKLRRKREILASLLKR